MAAMSRRASRWTSRRELRMQAIVEADRRAAVAVAQEKVIERFMAEAPYSYQELRQANAERRLAMLLRAIEPNLLRAQTVRFLVERQQATNQGWHWGEVDEVQRVFVGLVAGEA
ncbi:MAG: hypothetical protein EI684_19905 [Candidatus Viridilinea halotolerans]|uniref:Uncharacterized protein n=1 Tax=Candidatus Viridilinea halotolerans TaxID=2491704 RepID=A0A426TSD6_9CHLR|nr:MAG: hypothetical protein EI684_19905 [Candidatus Viridilinea halotolerans]